MRVGVDVVSMQDRDALVGLRGNLRSKQRIAVSGLEPKGGRRTSTVVLSFLEYHVSTRALANGTRSKAPYGGAEGEIRTHTGYNSQRFLRPPRLPFRHFGRCPHIPIIPTRHVTVNRVRTGTTMGVPILCDAADARSSGLLDSPHRSTGQALRRNSRGAGSNCDG